MRHHPFYCEENVWWLVREGPLPAPSYAVFISNEERAVALAHQRLAPPRRPIVWDYHVIAIDAGAQVWDLDSRLPRPIDLATYLDETFLDPPPGAERFAPRFRVVAAAELEARFASDRSHMRAADGGYLRPPPPWPPIGGTMPSNLRQLVDMSQPAGGEVYDIEGLRTRFGVGAGSV